ncbi:MAG: hypothetical protein ABIC04_05615 [Nanoarchaeota archaeon]
MADITVDELNGGDSDFMRRLRAKAAMALKKDVGKAATDTARQVGGTIGDVTKQMGRTINESTRQYTQPAMDMARAGKEAATRMAKQADNASKEYIPTFRKMAIRGAQAAGEAASNAKSSAKRVVGEHFDTAKTAVMGTAAAGMRTVLDSGTTMFLFITVFFMYGIDWFVTGFDGIKFVGNYSALWTTLQGVLMDKVFWVICIMIFALKFRVNADSAREWLSYAVLVYIFLLIIYCGGITTGWAHLIFPMMYYWSLMRVNHDITSANVIFAGLLAFDFFGYAILANYFPGNTFILNRLIVPIWFYVVWLYTVNTKKNGFTAFLVFFVITFNIFAVGGAISVETGGFMGAQLSNVNREAAIKYFEDGFKNAWETYKTSSTKFAQGAKDAVTKQFEAQMEFATGGYYVSQAEKSTGTPVDPGGVFIQNIQKLPAEPLKGQRVYVYGHVKVHSPDKQMEIPVNLGCKRNDVSIDLKPSNFKAIGTGETTIECSLGPLEAVSQTVKLSAMFDFSANADYKTYFIDGKEKINLKLKGEDPLVFYKGNVDKNIKSVSRPTDGPVSIGIGIGLGDKPPELPIGIIETEDNTIFLENSVIGFTIENKWTGKIKNIRELIIELPEGLSLRNDIVGQFDNVDTTTEQLNSICNGWFKPVEGSKTRYNLTKAGLEDVFKLPKTPIAQSAYKTIRCHLAIDSKNDILKNEKVPLKYFRVYLNYTYFNEVALPAFTPIDSGKLTETAIKKVLQSCTDLCDDDKGCRCANESCVGYNKEIKKNENCGGLKASAATSNPATGKPTNLAIIINDGAAVTDQLNVKLTLKAENVGSNTICKIKNHGKEWVEGAYVTDMRWDLDINSYRPGDRVVYYQCNNGQDVSDQVSAAIRYETTVEDIYT